METGTNKFLESEIWIQLIENEMDGINSKEQTDQLVNEGLTNSKELDEAFQAIRVSRRAMAQEMMNVRIQKILDEPATQYKDDHNATIIRPLELERSPAWLKTVSWKTVAGLAACFLLILGLSYFYAVENQDQPIALNSAADTLLVQNLFQEQFVASVLVSESKGADDRLAGIKDKLNDENVDINAVLKVLSTIPDNSIHEVNFLRGYALLQAGAQSVTMAMAELKKATQSTDRIIKEEAEWYLAMAYLKAFDLTNAYPLFQQLAESQNGHQLFAKEIVEKLTKK